MADDRGRVVSPGFDATLTAGDEAALGETAPALDDDTGLQPGDEVGRFTLEERLGVGGMGAVFAAHDPDLDRRVAVKVLREDTTGRDSQSPAYEQGRARLLREARAMARLSHPNVITVYEVGVVTTEGRGDQVFIAMELVSGGTLATWLAAEPRPWREVIDRVVAAGRGLEAAHAAGLVHRDFKPDNVLLSAGGEVRVTDFGLAAMAGQERTAAPVASDSGAREPLAQLTATGARMGTPYYMSPEAHAGKTVDARSDQFSFCVTLFQALYGERPFAGDTYDELLAAVSSGRVRQVPTSSDVPARLGRIVVRGLAADPAARYPSMTALLADVETALRRRRRVRMAVVGAVAGVGALAAAVLVGRLAVAPAPFVCTGADERMADVWSGARRDEVARAFAAVSLPMSAAVARSVQARLDDYAAEWTAMYTDACRATRVRKEQSEAVMDLRMDCLERRRTELMAVVDLLAHADEPVVLRANELAAAPADVAVCGDLAALRAVVPPPDPHVRSQVLALQAEYDRANMAYRGGRFEDTLPVVDELLARVEPVGYDPLTAEVLLLRGQLLGRLNRGKDAVASLQRAAEHGLSGRHDLIAAKAWGDSVYYHTLLRQRDEAERAASLARSALERVGGDPAVEAALENNVGVFHWHGNDLEAAADSFRRALAVLERHFGADHVKVAGTLDNLASVYGEQGKGSEALDLYRRALGIRELHLGPDHPDVAITLTNLGLELNFAGKYSEAVEVLERAVAIKTAALGADNPGLSTTLTNLGKSYREVGRFAESARTYQRAADLFAAADPPRMITSAAVLSNVGWALALDHRYDEAVVVTQRAIDIYVAEGKGDDPDVSAMLRDLAAAEVARGNHRQARAHVTRALAIDAKAYSPGDHRRADSLGEMGRVELAAGNVRGAIGWLERALAARGESPRDSLGLARDRWSLARALWSRPRDRERAIAMARQAFARYTRAGASAQAEREALAAWLASRK